MKHNLPGTCQEGFSMPLTIVESTAQLIKQHKAEANLSCEHAHFAIFPSAGLMGCKKGDPPVHIAANWAWWVNNGALRGFRNHERWLHGCRCKRIIGASLRSATSAVHLCCKAVAKHDEPFKRMQKLRSPGKHAKPQEQGIMI